MDLSNIKNRGLIQVRAVDHARLINDSHMDNHWEFFFLSNEFQIFHGL